MELRELGTSPKHCFSPQRELTRCLSDTLDALGPLSAKKQTVKLEHGWAVVSRTGLGFQDYMPHEGSHWHTRADYKGINQKISALVAYLAVAPHVMKDKREAFTRIGEVVSDNAELFFQKHTHFKAEVSDSAIREHQKVGLILPKAPFLYVQSYGFTVATKPYSTNPGNLVTNELLAEADRVGREQRVVVDGIIRDIQEAAIEFVVADQLL